MYFKKHLLFMILSFALITIGCSDGNSHENSDSIEPTDSDDGLMLLARQEASIDPIFWTWRSGLIDEIEKRGKHFFIPDGDLFVAA